MAGTVPWMKRNPVGTKGMLISVLSEEIPYNEPGIVIYKAEIPCIHGSLKNVICDLPP